MIILPAIDLYEKKAVRLLTGDYNKMTVYSDDPLSVASDFEKCGTVKFDRHVFLTTHKKHIRHNGIPNSSATIYSETERSVSEYEKTKNHNSFTHNGALCIGCFKWLCGKRGKPDGTQPVNYQLNAF